MIMMLMMMVAVYRNCFSVLIIYIYMYLGMMGSIYRNISTFCFPFVPRSGFSSSPGSQKFYGMYSSKHSTTLFAFNSTQTSIVGFLRSVSGACIFSAIECHMPENGNI